MVRRNSKVTPEHVRKISLSKEPGGGHQNSGTRSSKNHDNTLHHQQKKRSNVHENPPNHPHPPPTNTNHLHNFNLTNHTIVPVVTKQEIALIGHEHENFVAPVPTVTKFEVKVDEEKGRPTAPFQPPYWEQKLGKNVQLFEELNKNPELKEAIMNSVRLAEEFMRHPDISRQVARDPKLARKVLERPELIKELALARYNMLDDMKHKLDVDPKAKIKVRRKSIEQKRLYDLKQKRNSLGGEEEVDEHDDERFAPQVSSSATSASQSESIVSIMSRATLPKVALASGLPNSIKYIAECSRLFLRHHVEITDGLANCCDHRREYYDVLNTYGRLLYRVYEVKKRKWCFGIFQGFKFMVKEPDGSPIIIMSNRLAIRSMRSIAVYCPAENLIGCVEETWGIFSPEITLKNEAGDTMIKVRVKKRPFSSLFKYNPEFEFELRTAGDHNAIGKISSEWLDLPPGVFPSQKVYGVNFPKALSPNVKVIIMTAWFLVYFLYYNGKLRKEIRHNLSENEQALIEYVYEDNIRKNGDISFDPSSDSMITGHGVGQ